MPYFRLQRLLPVPELTCPALTADWYCESLDESVTLVASSGGRAHLAGLFEAFFETYWVRHTVLRQVAFMCDIEGDVTVDIVRRQVANGHENIVAHGRGRGRTSLCVPVDLAENGETYLTIRLNAAPEARIMDAAWYTSTPALRHPAIGIAITTFNRDDFVRRNLVKLGRWLAPEDEVVVVNHGEPGLAARLAETRCEQASICIVDQENSGGAGGFTRGMRMLKAAGRVSHILLMDDDIDIPPDMLARLRAILAYADRPLCIGGAMFDYEARSRLFTKGDVLVPGSLWIGHIVPPEGCDVLETKGVDFMAAYHKPDFNGWWCFTMPVAAIETVGWPLQCFIRGDDVEYGYRLKREGWPTTGWPGVAVWHLPFADKAVAWHMFYDRRNTLFANALHRRVGRLGVFRELGSSFIHYYLRYDYQRVYAMTLGIEAYNRGAAAMLAWTHHDHARLVTATAPNQAFTVQEGCPVVDPQRIASGRRRSMAFRILRDLYWPLRKAGPVRLMPGIRWRPDYTIRPAVVLETSISQHTQHVYHYHWGRAWTCFWRFSWALIRLMIWFRQQVPVDRS